MSRATNYAENVLLNAMFGRGAFPVISHLYMGLFKDANVTADSMENGSLFGEVTGGNYSRVTVHSTLVMGAANNGVIRNITDIVFPQASAIWGTLSYMGLMDSALTGTMMLYASLSSPLYIGAGEQARIDPSVLVFTCD